LGIQRRCGGCGKKRGRAGTRDRVAGRERRRRRRGAARGVVVVVMMTMMVAAGRAERTWWRWRWYWRLVGGFVG
jgi:hypothetical protein